MFDDQVVGSGARVAFVFSNGYVEVKRWRIGDDVHPWILRPVTGRLDLGRSWAVELIADDDGDGLIDEDPLELFDLDLDGLIDEDGPDPQFDNDGDGRLNEDGLYTLFDDDWDGQLNEDPINGIDDDGDGFIDEDPSLPEHGQGVTTWLRPVRLDSLRNLAYLLNQRFKAGEFGGIIPGKDPQRPFMVVPSEYGFRREIADPISAFPLTFSSSSIRSRSNSKSTICRVAALPRSSQGVRRRAVSKSSGMAATVRAKSPRRASISIGLPSTWTTSPRSVRAPYRWPINQNGRVDFAQDRP